MMRGKSKGCEVPEDTVFFAIYPDQLVSASNSQSGKENQEFLQTLRASCLDAVSPFLTSYIWQHQVFDLSLSTSLPDPICHPSGSPSPSPEPPHLHGKLRFGDNVEDEWFCVFLLLHISASLANVSARVWDSDGEFLLIEAAYHLPRWLKPETSSNRVFLRNGALHIIPLPSSPAELFLVPLNPSLADSLDLLRSGSVPSRAGDAVQSVLSRRVLEYPGRAEHGMHRARCRLPLPVAQTLEAEPQLIALAVDAFYNRDIDSMNAASKMNKFLRKEGNTQAEMVDMLVRMSRTMYAQLTLQTFQAPPCYPMPPLSDPLFKEAELGMKISCGFEMMYWERSQYTDSSNSDQRVEAGIQKGIVASGDRGWQAFQASLEEKGYYRGLLQGSKEYRQLMEAAMARYRQTELFTKTSTIIHAPVKRIEEILALPCTVEDFHVYDLQKSDDDSWIFTGEEELKIAMSERQKEMDAYEARKQRSKGARMSEEHMASSDTAREHVEGCKLEDIASSMKAFVDKLSSFEGAELPNDREHCDQDSVSINIERFMKELNSAFGLKDATFGEDLDLMEDMDSSSCDLDTDESEESEGMAEEQIEAGRNGKGESAVFMDEYSEALSRQLGDSSLVKSFAREESVHNEEVEEGEKSLPPVNVDLNLVQNLLESVSSQWGLPGPASNLLGAMGLQLPKGSEG